MSSGEQPGFGVVLFVGNVHQENVQGQEWNLPKELAFEPFSRIAGSRHTAVCMGDTRTLGF